jgi:uncharacterized protein (DUF488 family)
MNLFTYGYVGRRVAGLVSVLETTPSALLVDVRLSARARDPAWSEASLRRMLGPRYLHVPQLGNVNYQAHDAPIQLADAQAGLRRVLKAASLLLDPRDVPTVVLLCACRERGRCHRDAVAKLLVEHARATDRGELFGEEPPPPREPRSRQGELWPVSHRR